MAANTAFQGSAIWGENLSFERRPRNRFIQAHSNCIGLGALRKIPELAQVLQVDGLASLTYDNSQRNDGAAQLLRTLIGERERISPTRITLGGSGLDWIATLAGSLGIQTIVRTAGDFHGFDRYAHLQGGHRITIPVDPITHLLDPAAVADAVRGLKAAMLCLTFPVTNPLQTPITRAHIVAAIEANPGLVVLVDAAYRQYGDHRRLAALADEFDQVIYLQVASKDLFLPGARMSWLVPSRRFNDRILETTPPYPLATIAIDQVIALLQRDDLIEALRREQAQARDYLLATLPRLGLPIIGGLGPWALIKWPTDAAKAVMELEQRFGILVQKQALSPLDGSWIRISATIAEESEQIVEALATLVHEIS